MSTTLYVDTGDNETLKFTNLKAPNNAKGTILINNGTGVDYLSVGTNDQILTSNTGASLLYSWNDPPTGAASNSVSQIIAGIRSEASGTNYSTYAYPSATNAWGTTYCEGIPIPYSNTDVVKFTVIPEINATWGSIPSGGSFDFTIGKLTNQGDIGASGSFTGYTGTGSTFSIDDTYANNRSPLVGLAEIDVQMNDIIAVRCENKVGYDLDISVFIFIKGALTF